jgi:hypothetical protein
MLKSVYAKLEDIPEGERQHYKQFNGQYVLELDEHHPVLVNKKQLRTESSGRQGTITKLTNDLAEAKARTVPEGHVVVPVADKEFIDKVKPLGSADEVKAKVTEHGDLKEKQAKADREKLLVEAAQANGFNPQAFLVLPSLPEIVVKEEADSTGNKVKKYFAKTKTGENTFSEQALGDYVKAEESYKPLMPALLAKPEQGTGGAGATRYVPVTPATSGQSGAGDDPVSKRLQERLDAREATPNALMGAPSVAATGAGGVRAASPPAK